MTLQVWTSRIDLLGRDPDVIDVSRAGVLKRPAGPGAPFAPSWDLLQPFILKRRAREPLDFEVYARRYTAEMRESYRRSRKAWEALLSRDRAVLCCYCVNPDECHRTVLARDILPKLGASYRGEVATMLALSVRQPWAWAILAGKDIENRSGRYWGAVRLPAEPVALHASIGCGVSEYREAATWIRESTGLEAPPMDALPRGELCGEMRLVGRVRESGSPWFFGPIGLEIQGQEPRPRVACRGDLGLFRVPRPECWPTTEKGKNIGGEEVSHGLR